MMCLASMGMSVGLPFRGVLPATLQEKILVAAAQMRAQSSARRRSLFRVQAQCSVDCQVWLCSLEATSHLGTGTSKTEKDGSECVLKGRLGDTRNLIHATDEKACIEASFEGSLHNQRVEALSQLSNTSQVSEDRRRFLLNYVQKVEPQIMEQFAEHAPAQVVDAMRTTISNMVGVLPPHLFDVTVSTVGESLAQLMFSVIMTGYLFRNAQYRLELQRSMDDADGLTLPPSSESAATPAASILWDGFAEGSQLTKVQGEVLRWHNEHGTTSVPAADYISMLENEVAALRKQVMMRQYQGTTSNELLDYLKCLDTKALGQLTACAGEDIMEAMNAFIHRLLGSSDDEELRRIPSQSNAVELARLLFWLMCVGYGLRTLEVRFDMEQSMMLEERDGGLGYLPP